VAKRRIRLTTQRIAAAACPAGKAHVLLWDSERPGLCVRVYPTGRKVFTLLYRAGGGGRNARLRWLTLGEVGAIGLADARDAAGIHLGAVAKGGDPAAQRREARREARALLEPAIARYGEELARRRLVRGRETISMLKRELLGPLGNVDLATLDRATMVERVAAIERSGLPGKAKDFRAKAGTFLNWAAAGGLIPANPLAGWRRQRRTRAERLARPGRALADAELPVLWRAIGGAEDPFFRAYLYTLLLTGQRRTETAQMRWSDLRTDAAGAIVEWQIPAEVTKAGRAHRVPVPPDLATTLGGLPRLAGTDLVFPGRGGRPMSGWSQRLAPVQAATAKAGLAPWTMHDLRRTVRTGLGRLGVDQEIAELMLNHAPGDELAAIYDRGDYWARRKEAAERWARHVSGLVADAAPESGEPTRAPPP
jgi:integrase